VASLISKRAEKKNIPMSGGGGNLKGRFAGISSKGEETLAGEKIFTLV